MKKSNKTFYVILAVVVAALGLLGYRNFFPASGDSTAVPCVNPALPVSYHIHPHLSIVIDGENITIPANIGLNPACHRILHTHDETGELHLEANKVTDLTLGDFMSVWNKPFSATRILDKTADAEREILMTVDGEPSIEFENLILKDDQKIVIEYKAK